jgi:predicted oxidoreductase
MAIPNFSKIIAGTMTWGTWGKNFTSIEMVKLMHHFIENNITTFDHADIYGSYTTEAAFGKSFVESGINRNEVQFISKCGIQLEDIQRKNIVKHYDYAAAHIIWSVEQSLKNLQTDYLDILLLHRPSPLMQVEEIAKAIDVLKHAGKIVDFGVSNFNASQINLLKKYVPIQCNQIEFSISHFDAMLNGNIDAMQEHKIIPMAWAPLGSVFKNEGEQATRIKILANSLAEKYEATVEVILLAWIMKHPAGILPVCGTTNFTRISHLQKANTVNMELQDWFALWQASSGVEAP